MRAGTTCVRKLTVETESRISVGSNSREFIEEIFADRDVSDIVFVTANPHTPITNSRKESEI
jgi:hypothetical protein